jgi:hypothetical protein
LAIFAAAIEKPAGGGALNDLLLQLIIVCIIALAAVVSLRSS